MGSGYNHHQNLQLQQKATFLPMLCSKPSIKDVALPKLEERSMSLSSDPLSPRIGCMGQVKRHNKIVGFPTCNNKITFSTTRNDNNTALVNYSKLKRIFSVKNTSTTTTTSIPNTSTNRRRGVMMLNGARRPKIEDSCVSVSVRIEEMDPPLPVIKKLHKPTEVDTIWKRRSRGLALKNLQLHLNTDNLAPTTV